MKKLTLILIFTLVAISVFSFDDQESRESLKGLETIYIIVTIRDEYQPVTISNIKTDVELQLRREGITVGQQSGETTVYLQDKEAFLYIEVHILKDKLNEFYAYSIMTKLEQNTLLPRLTESRDTYFLACTWEVGRTGYVSIQKLNRIREIISDSINQFLNAYLSVNPK